MVTWVDQVHKRASAFQGQIAAAKAAEAGTGIDLSGMIDLYRLKLEEMYLEEMPLAKIMDTSDLVFHAEGPSTTAGEPGLRAFNWLCVSAEKQLRMLAKAIFNLTDLDAKRLAKNLDLRFSGFAPGSIYAGFSIAPMDSIMDSDEPESVHEAIKFAIRQLPTIPEFIEDESLNLGIAELIPDPAMRDASLEALFRLSPTGKVGIHTLDISSPDAGQSELGNRERVVLRDALRKPVTLKKRFGEFIGEVREVDLDSGRFHLRNISGVGTLRCVLPSVTSEIGQKILGSVIAVSGDYECDASGRPRLMFAHDLKLVREMSEQHRISV